MLQRKWRCKEETFDKKKTKRTDKMMRSAGTQACSCKMLCPMVFVEPVCSGQCLRVRERESGAPAEQAEDPPWRLSLGGDDVRDSRLVVELRGRLWWRVGRRVVDVADFKEKLEWFERLLGSFLVVRKVVERGEQGENEVMWELGKCKCRRAFSGVGLGLTRFFLNTGVAVCGGRRMRMSTSAAQTRKKMKGRRA